MPRRSHRARSLAAATTALLATSLVGLPGLVLCIGSDGHRALEIEHTGVGCPEAGTGAGGPALAATGPVGTDDCLDLPAAGSALAASSADGERPSAPVVALDRLADPPIRGTAHLAAALEARAGPCALAPHLATTVLLV